MTLPGGDRRDAGRWGRPAYDRAETVTNTYSPDPLSSEPLTSSYGWTTRLVVSGLVVGLCVLAVIRSATEGWWQALLVLLLVWALYGVPVWLRGHLGLRVDGSRCEVRGRFGTTAFEGTDVTTVRYVFNGRSPDTQLVLRDGRKVMVATSQLEKGHSVLYEWLRRYAPDAEYDPKAEDLRTTLVNRGLVGAPGEAWDEQPVALAGQAGPGPGSVVAAPATPDPDGPAPGPDDTPPSQAPSTAL